MSEQYSREALIRDLSLVLSWAFHPLAEIGIPSRLAARRLRDALGIKGGAHAESIEARMLEALTGEPAAVKPRTPSREETLAVMCPHCRAQPWQPCRDYLGGTVLKLHARRVRAAMASAGSAEGAG